MRTTVTLDADTESLVRRAMREKGISFKQALNDAIRSGATPLPASSAPTHVKRLGVPSVNLDHSLRLAAELEDDELTRRIEQG